MLSASRTRQRRAHVFRKTAADTNGEYLEMDLYLAPDGHVPGAHVHPKQEERFEVLAGTMELRMGRAEGRRRPRRHRHDPAGLDREAPRSRVAPRRAAAGLRLAPATAAPPAAVRGRGREPGDVERQPPAARRSTSALSRSSERSASGPEAATIARPATLPSGPPGIP